MGKSKKVKEATASYVAATADLAHPLIVEQDGQPMAVLLSMEEYKRYQTSCQRWL